MVRRKNWIVLFTTLLLILLGSYLLLKIGIIDVEKIKAQGNDFHYNAISTSAVIGGFLFTGISILISAISNERIKRLWDNNYLDNLYRAAFVGMISNVLTTLTMTQAYKNKTERFGSPEYKELCKYMNTYPGLKIEIIEKLPTSKKTPKEKSQKAPSLTYKQMIDYMKNFGEQTSALMKEFEGVRKLSCIQANPYRYVRNWFDKKFTNVEVDENGNLIIKTIEEKKAEEGKVVEMPTAQQEETIPT